MSPEAPPDLRPGALLLSGIRRGAVLVFLPVALAAQAVAWIAYAASGWFHAWSWAKIGLAYALLSVRVPFEASMTRAASGRSPATVPLELAVGAFTVAILLLSFRAGRAQARGFEHRPGPAALSGAATGFGVALPMFLAAFLIRLRLPTLGIASLRPILWGAFLVPLVVVGVAGAVGGISVAGASIEDGTGWRPRLAAATRGGAVAAWWGLLLAFVAFLLLAAAFPRVTTAYARGVSHLAGGGAVLMVHHALLLPNQSALLLAVTMGSPAGFALASGQPAATVSLHALGLTGDAGSFLAAFFATPQGGLSFPAWFWAFLAVPTVATVLGGHRAASDATSRPEGVVRGALAGVVFAVLVTAAAWASGIVLSLRAAEVVQEPSLGVGAGRTFVIALGWGVLGGVAGALLPLGRVGDA